MNLKQAVKERDEAFIDLVQTGSMKKLRKYARKYGVAIPKSERVAKAGVYKAVQHCTNIPQEIKDKAFDECIKLGFSPYMN